MKKIKIILIEEAMRDGVGQHVTGIVKNLEQRRYQIYVVYSDLRADKKFRENKVNLERYDRFICCKELRRELSVKDFIAYKGIKKIIMDIRPEIVHCHSSKAGLVGRLAAKKCKVPFIIYTPNAYAFQSPDISLIKKYIYIYAEKVLSRYATSLTINVSKGEMNLAQDFKLDRSEKSKLIHNGIPYARPKGKWQIGKKLGLDEH